MNEIEEMDADSEEIHSNGLLHCIYKDLLALKMLLKLTGLLCIICARSPLLTKKSKSVDVDNLPLEKLDDEINVDELLDCAKETLQIEKKKENRKSM